MKKFLIATIAMSLCAFAGAQTVAPTVDTTAADQVNIGTTSASVSQNVKLVLPEATALHLTASNLVFDISQIGNQDSTWYCAQGLGNGEDVEVGMDADNFWGQTSTLPLGTYYTVGEFPKIEVVAGERITQYPPVKLGDNGKVDNASKAYFVCYRTFIMQKFSNVGNFRLSVTRDDPADSAMGHQLIYVQDDPCWAWGDVTGLYKINEGATTQLIPKNMGRGTTGALAASTGDNNQCRKYSSWADDVVVVAVVVDGDKAGTNTAVLTYTLESSANGW